MTSPAALLREAAAAAANQRTWIARRQQLHLGVSIGIALMVVAQFIVGFWAPNPTTAAGGLVVVAANLVFSFAWMRPAQLERRWARKHPAAAGVLASEASAAR